MPLRMERWCNKLVIFIWTSKSSTVNTFKTRPSTLASKNVSLYWGSPTSSSHLVTQWWSRPPWADSIFVSCLAFIDKTNFFRCIGDFMPKKCSRSAILILANFSPFWTHFFISVLYIPRPNESIQTQRTSWDQSENGFLLRTWLVGAVVDQPKRPPAVARKPPRLKRDEMYYFWLWAKFEGPKRRKCKIFDWEQSLMDIFAQ